jgi:hypothetical protein
MTADIRAAWSQIPAPPESQLQWIPSICSEDALKAFVGIAPVDVDVSSQGFLGCTPLLDLPPQAAAAYLGSYVLSLLDGLSLQEQSGLFLDIVTRAHVLHCLSNERFWRTVIRPHLPSECRHTLIALAEYLASRADLLGFSKGEADLILDLATA